MKHHLSKRLKNIPPYKFVELGQRIKQLRAAGHDVIRLDIGSPDLPPPPRVIEALHNNVGRADIHGYPGYGGIHELKQAFADYYQRRFNVQLNPANELLPLLGSKEGIVNFSLSYLNPRDIVLVPDPGYPTYTNAAWLANAEPYYVPLRKEHHYLPDVDAIPEQITKRTRLFWINYPHNPTGAIGTTEAFTKIVSYCLENNIILCSDNPYSDINFGQVNAPVILQIPDAKKITIEFNSLSKTYNMAGWRIGIATGNASLIAGLAHTKANVDSGIFLPLQIAGSVALESAHDTWIHERNIVYRHRRDLVMSMLSGTGLSAQSPSAGIYIWAKVYDGDDLAYTSKALENTFVSLAPGSTYGTHGDGYVRISLVAPEDRLEDAMLRLQRLHSA